jgi:hypothetical protein
VRAEKKETDRKTERDGTLSVMGLLFTGKTAG